MKIGLVRWTLAAKDGSSLEVNHSIIKLSGSDHEKCLLQQVNVHEKLPKGKTLDDVRLVVETISTWADED